MKRKISVIKIFVLIIILFFSMTACEGPMGPMGPMGPQGEQGQQGEKGEDGNHGNDGAIGSILSIGENGNWFINDVDTGIKAQGDEGIQGSHGNTPHIGENGNWWIGNTDTGLWAGTGIKLVIIEKPTKLSYYTGQGFNSAGLVVRVYDGELQSENVTGYSFFFNGQQFSNGSNIATAEHGEKIITLTLASLSVNFKINVIDTVNVSNLTEWNSVLTNIRGGGNNAKLTINITGNITGITPLTAAPTSSTGFGTVTNTTITLTGNGTLNTSNANGHMFRLGSGQTLIIDSSNLTLNGRRNGENGHTADNNTSVVHVQSGANLQLKNGTITGNTSTGNTATTTGTVNVLGNFIMSGGSITNNTGNGSAYGVGGVTLNTNGSFIMSGGEIKNNIATSGGAVFISSSGSFFSMQGGKISGNTANAGGGIYSWGSFIMEGGEISDNSATGNGSSVNCQVGSNFIMKGGVIKDNHQSSQCIFICENFSMEGGEIIGNSRQGVLAWISDIANGSITLSGNARINNNITLYNNDNNYASIVINSDWIGNISNINLYGSDTEMATIISYWQNKVILRAASGHTLNEADITKFPLLNFISRASNNNTQTIGNTHELVLDEGGQTASLRTKK